MGDFFSPYSAPSDGGMHVCQDGEVVRNVWGEWIVHNLVLLSFFIQLVLFVSASFRRRTANAVLRSFLWLMYLLADSVATYTLGHLFVTTNCGEQRLVAFWAPFLLLHLGGQDTITAYALEDNRLWLRHLQALVVQVSTASFVLIGYFAAGGWALVTAGVFMFAVGFLKYGERIWALRCAGNDGLYSFLIRYCKQQPAPQMQLQQIGPQLDHENMGRDILDELHREEERVMHGAHTLLGISLCMFLDGEEETCRHNNGALSVLAYLVTNGDSEIYRVIEMQLSLMYDLMYTKARVIHTWYGLCIRVFSLLAIVATVILMIGFVDKDNTTDTAITYVLLFGALVMEIASGFIAIVSTWTRHQQNMHGWIWNLVVYLRWIVKAKWWRRWSGVIGQFNMIEYAESSLGDADGISWMRLFQGKLSVLSPPIKVSSHMETSIRNEIKWRVESCGGAAEVMYTLNRKKIKLNEHWDFDSKVIIWHIATHLILDYVIGENQDTNALQERIKGTKALSDYMMYLHSQQPDMLPGHTRRSLYTEAIEYLQDLGRIHAGDSILPTRLNLSSWLQAEGGRRREHGENSTCCMKGAALASELILELDSRRDSPAREDSAREDSSMDSPAREDSSRDSPSREDLMASMLDEMFGVWVEMLCYAGSHSSRDSHARGLSRGGEFLTVVWLLAGHCADYERSKPDDNVGTNQTCPGPS